MLWISWSTAGASLLALPLATFGFAVQDASPAGIVLEVNGQAEVHKRGYSPAPAALGTPLMEGDSLIPSRGGHVVVLYRSGRRETVARAARIASPADGESVGYFVRTIRTLMQVAAGTPNVMRSGAIRNPAMAKLLAPSHDVALLDRRPTFIWTAVPGASGYRIRVENDTDPLLEFTVGVDTVWTIPAHDPTLRDGVAYRWNATSLPMEQASFSAEFRIASQEERAAIDLRVQELARAGLIGDAGLLARALEYFAAGFFYEARDELDKLERRCIPLDRRVRLLQAEILGALGEWERAARASSIMNEMAAGSATAEPCASSRL